MFFGYSVPFGNRATYCVVCRSGYSFHLEIASTPLLFRPLMTLLVVFLQCMQRATAGQVGCWKLE